MERHELEKLGEAELRHRLARGDYANDEAKQLVTQWLSQLEDERLIKESYQRASEAAAFNNQRHNRNMLIVAIATAIAAIMSTISTIVMVFSQRQ